MNAIPAENLPQRISQYAPGIYPDVPAEVYHQRELGVVNTGALKILASQTPAHYKAWVDDQTEQPETPALVFGSALHALVLEPGLFAKEWALCPDFGDLRTKKAREARDAWAADNPGVRAVSADDWRRLHAMRESIMRHPVAGKVFTGGRAEVTAVWTDPRTGLVCKARYDYEREDINLLADLKSTDDASPRAFARSIAKFQYHIQDAHYSDGPRVLRGEETRFLFVAVEKQPPYCVGTYMLDTESAMRGEEMRARGMEALDECLRTDAWPSYPNEVNTIALPNWAFSD